MINKVLIREFLAREVNASIPRRNSRDGSLPVCSRMASVAFKYKSTVLALSNSETFYKTKSMSELGLSYFLNLQKKYKLTPIQSFFLKEKLRQEYGRYFVAWIEEEKPLQFGYQDKFLSRKFKKFAYKFIDYINELLAKKHSEHKTLPLRVILSAEFAVIGQLSTMGKL